MPMLILALRSPTKRTVNFAAAAVAAFCLACPGVGRAGDAYADNSPVASPSGVRISAEAGWKDQMYNNKRQRMLSVSLVARGPAAATASAYGDLTLDSIRDEQGRPVKPWPISLAIRGGASEEALHLVLREGITENHPPDGVRFSIDFQNPGPLKRLSELSGSLALRTGGRIQEVIVPGVLMQKSLTVQDPTLKDLGITLRLTRTTRPPAEAKTKTGISRVDGKTVSTLAVISQAVPADELGIKIEVASTTVVSVEMADRGGKPLKPVAWGMKFGETVKSATLRFKDKLPDDGQLRLRVHRDAQRLRVPFALKDIEIMPEGETDGLRFPSPFPVSPGGQQPPTLGPNAQIQDHAR